MEELKVFISHRHADKGIANAINEELQEWGMAPDKIFMSSSDRADQTVLPGEDVPDEIIHSLSSVNLLILVYTFNDEDWSWCMWECGLVTGLSQGKTRVVVFQCTSDVPKIFQNKKTDCL